jgi:hypothetical protein
VNSAATLLTALGIATLCTVLLVVYGLRVLLRIVALRAAVGFFQAPGTNGNVIMLAREMFTYLASGKGKR